MNKSEKEDIQDKIDDLILGLLPEHEIKNVEKLIADSAELSGYYRQQQELIALVKENTAADPGADFWSEFPDQVLNECQKQQPQEFTGPDRKGATGVVNDFIEWLTGFSYRPVLMPVAAFGVVLVITTVILIDITSTDHAQRFSEQQRLWSNARINPGLLKVYQPTAVNHYAFSETATDNLFVLGQQYSLSIAYFLLNEMGDSKKQLASMSGLLEQQSFDVLTEGVFVDISKSINDRLADESYALFELGGWLMNIQLILLSEQSPMLHDFNQADQFRARLGPLNLPQSIYSQLAELDRLLKVEQPGQREIKSLNKILAKLRNILA